MQWLAALSVKRPVLASVLILTLTVVGVFSFTRLMHILVAPVPYLWRQTQVVIWNRDRRKLRRVVPIE